MALEYADKKLVLEHATIEALLRDLTAIRADMESTPNEIQARLTKVAPHHLESARNLLHYLAFRRRDLRSLQQRLAALGLSSLGRAEAHVLASVDAVIHMLRRLAPCEQPAPADAAAPIDFTKGQRLLAKNSETLLGPAPSEREVRIMVTMPSEAARDYTLVHDLVKQGMDCMRINCAHDDAVAWLRMIEHLRRAERSLGRSCRILMDLAGPKLRTGPVAPGPCVVRVRPQRDELGRVTAPARIWLTSAAAPQPAPTRADACLAVDATWLASLDDGDAVHCRDARAAKRTMSVVDVAGQGCWAEATQTVYLVPGTVLHHKRGGKTEVERLPALAGAIVLLPGDELVITRDLEPGRPATRDSSGLVLTPAIIGCTLADAFDDLRTGEAIALDDGKIGGFIERIEGTRLFVRITRARLCGEKLRGDKGINLPDSTLRLPALTAKDLEDLAFVARHADMVAISFVNRAADVDELLQHLAKYTGRSPAIVLKIETRRGFESLPDMLLTALQAPSCGVMIARGDLAVECGFERLAEVQEEILWSCEAAHVPVIWATQVLETLAKDGMPSRAEITDAAMAQRAECVMLNKGPHVLRAVQVLDDILRRMQSHQSKKRALLRELRLAHALPTG